MKLRRRDMKKISESLNDVFYVLNELTGSKVFQSTVFKLPKVKSSDLEDLLHMNICGRDIVLDDKFEVQDRGMSIHNEFIRVLKGSSDKLNKFCRTSGHINPMYSPVLDYESQPSPKMSNDVEMIKNLF
jgi:hypothetical protein|tara:strand:+ start:1451 stop:1837 length:387 start_codon:yes stop_codon:yes gene_type:complete